MPFLQNAKKEIAQVYEPEVAKLLKAGWTELTAKAEAAYREVLAKDHSLTSAVAIEEARVKAGVYDVLNKVEGAVKADAKKAVQTAKKAVSKTASKGSKTNATSSK